MDSQEETTERQGETPRRDALTIGRFLLLTAGVAVGLGVFVSPHKQGGGFLRFDLDTFLVYYNAVFIGLALPAPLFVMGQRLRKGPPIGPGGLYAVTVGLGSLLMLPPVLVGRLQSDVGPSFTCIHYTMPLVSFWYLAATLLAGRLGRELFSRATPWTERYGFFLAVLWTPVGMWLLFGVFYAGAF